MLNTMLFFLHLCFQWLGYLVVAKNWRQYQFLFLGNISAQKILPLQSLHLFLNNLGIIYFVYRKMGFGYDFLNYQKENNKKYKYNDDSSVQQDDSSNSDNSSDSSGSDNSKDSSKSSSKSSSSSKKQ